MAANVFIIALIVCAVGCKQKPGADRFKRTSDDATQFWGEVPLNDRGEATARLTVPLDHVKEGVAKDGKHLPSCLPALGDPSVVIGRAVCATDPKITAPITVGHVHQECYSDTTVEPAISHQTLTLANCRQARILTFTHDPELRVDMEPVARH